MPLTITAIVCAFNEAAYLGPCLHSLLAQTRPPDEILVVDSASTGRNAHIIALDIKSYISADQSPDEILHEIRRQDALSIACHPHHRAVRRLEISTCYLWDHRKRLADLVDVWEAANRDDLFSVTSLKQFPYVASSDFHKPKHLYSWKTLLRCEKSWPAIRRALVENVDVALTLLRKESWTAATAAAPVRESGRARAADFRRVPA